MVNKKEKPKIKPSEVKIERLNKNHNLKSLESYEPELIDFLLEDALDNQDKQISVTYLWFIRKTNELCGYITLLNDRINLTGNLKTVFRGKGINYKALPALKVGRLCVDNKFIRRGLGSLMISFAIQNASKIFNESSGCRFITLDAKRNKDLTLDAIHFYKKLQFNILRERKKDTTAMYLDLVTDIKSNS